MITLKKVWFQKVALLEGIIGSDSGRNNFPGQYPTGFIQKAVLSLTFCLIH